MRIVLTSATMKCSNICRKLRTVKKKHKGQLATITYETIRYLENTPCNEQTPESIQQCLRALVPYNLNKTEKLMIINSPPSECTRNSIEKADESEEEEDAE
ncbi:hypothetical protein NQ317_000295 [Molorchus minor]|uniref:DNA-directed RNA polymerase III subunit RPC9 n=1 Tax=Molorchus minor TaxID=1323400 RepID=A0ABQ9JCS9_9CUCU|nr:hypothetical protein NQ317_000295 [Molorchus minor]